MITAYHTYVYPVARYVICNLQPKIDKKHIFQFLQICSLLYLWFMMADTLGHKCDAFGTQGISWKGLCTPHRDAFCQFPFRWIYYYP